MKLGTKVMLTPDSYWEDKELPSGAIGIIIDFDDMSGDDIEADIEDEGYQVDFGTYGIFWVYSFDLSVTDKAMNYPSMYGRILI